MSEETTTTSAHEALENTETPVAASAPAETTPVAAEAAPAPVPSRGGRGGNGGQRDDRGGRGGRRDDRRGGKSGFEPVKKEFEEVLLEVGRVTKVTSGGRQLRFRAAVVIGDRKGRVGFGL